MAQLLDGFRLMARNENDEKHEYWRNPNYVHSDGWGIAVKRLGNLNFIRKRLLVGKILCYF